MELMDEKSAKGTSIGKIALSRWEKNVETNPRSGKKTLRYPPGEELIIIRWYTPYGELKKIES